MMRCACAVRKLLHCKGTFALRAFMPLCFVARRRLLENCWQTPSHALVRCGSAGMSTRREELLKKKAALDSALVTVRKQVKAAQKRQRLQWCFPAPLQRAALILFDKGQHGLAAAAAFLAQEAQRRQWPEKPLEEVRMLPQSWFLAIDIDEFAALCDAANPKDPAAMRLATKFWPKVIWHRARLGLGLAGFASALAWSMAPSRPGMTRRRRS